MPEYDGDAGVGRLRNEDGGGRKIPGEAEERRRRRTKKHLRNGISEKFWPTLNGFEKIQRILLLF